MLQDQSIDCKKLPGETGGLFNEEKFQVSSEDSEPFPAAYFICLSCITPRPVRSEDDSIRVYCFEHPTQYCIQGCHEDENPPSSTPSWRGHYSKTKMETGGFGLARQFATPTETPRRLPRRLRGAGDNALVLMPSPMKYARACLAGEFTLFVVYSGIESV